LKDQSFKNLFQKTVFTLFTDKKDKYINQNKNYNSLTMLLQRTGDEFLIALTESTIMELMPLFYESPELKEFTKKEKSIYLNEEFLKQKKTTLFTFEGFKEYISHDYAKGQSRSKNKCKNNIEEDKWVINEMEKIFKIRQSNEALLANQIVKDQI
jgi:ribonucleotide reductase alpha subunit